MLNDPLSRPFFDLIRKEGTFARRMTQSDCESKAGGQPFIRLVCWLVSHAAWLPPRPFNYSWPRAEPAVHPPQPPPQPPPLLSNVLRRGWHGQTEIKPVWLRVTHTSEHTHSLANESVALIWWLHFSQHSNVTEMKQELCRLVIRCLASLELVQCCEWTKFGL